MVKTEGIFEIFFFLWIGDARGGGRRKGLFICGGFLGRGVGRIGRGRGWMGRGWERDSVDDWRSRIHYLENGSIQKAGN